MKKIAIKVKLPDRGRATLPLKQAGKVLGEEFSEFDRVFLPLGYQQVYGDASRSPKLIIRAIKRGSKETHQLIFKRFIAEHTIVCYQTQIFDFAQLSHIITHIGYEFYGQVDKVRAQVLSGDILISLDTIDQHETYYLKIERIVPDDAPADVGELLGILHSLDLGDLLMTGEYVEIEKGAK